MGRQGGQFDGVIFDMDGVLCDSEPFICEAACRMFASHYGCRVQPEDFLPFIGTGEGRYIGGVAEKYGVTLEGEVDKARTYDIYLEIIKGRLQPLPGAPEFIADCRKKALRLAVATSADRRKLDGNLAQIGLPSDLFDVCVTGSEVERKKPDPQIFLLAAERLNLSPARCLVVEDAPNGVVAAKAAEARCLGLSTSFKPELLLQSGADWIAPDLANVPDGLARLLM